MKVLLIADPHLPVPPKGYGGTERIVHLVAQGLAESGHEVVLLAREGSRSPGALFHHRAPAASFVSRARRKLSFQPLSLVAARGCDVVHNFGRVDYLYSLLRLGPPLAVTFENPIAPYELEILRRARKPSAWISISDAQRSGAGEGPWRTIYNAVDTTRLRYHERPAPDPYLAFLGRLTPNKGVHVAIDVAERAGLPLKIAGNVSNEPGAREYFVEQVRPRLRGKIEWIGEIGDEQKNGFLGGASALLFPIQWQEPFGIVVAESLACGTPVIATRAGATAELIDHGRTGALCHDLDELVEAAQAVEGLNRGACRATAEARFSAEAMTRAYLSAYEELLASK